VLFAALREAGIVPKWNASVSELRALVSSNAPVTRTAPLQNENSNAADTANQNQEPEPRTKGKSKTKPSSAAPPDLPVSAELWEQFREVRKRLKAPMTAEGERLLVLDLHRYAKEGGDPTAIVEQSIKRSWKGFFPIDERGQAVGQKRETQADKRSKVAAEMYAHRDKKDDAIDGTAERVD
jgi:hypothetical protein